MACRCSRNPQEEWPDLRLAVLVPDAFMRALQNNEDWAFWDPSRAKRPRHQYSAGYDVALNDLKNQQVQPRFVVKASRVWRDLIERMENFQGPGLVFPGNQVSSFQEGMRSA